jgi:hypothetical protein
MIGACCTRGENKTNKSTQYVKTVRRIYDHLAIFTGTNFCWQAFREFETATSGPGVKQGPRCYIRRSEWRNVFLLHVNGKDIDWEYVFLNYETQKIKQKRHCTIM